MKVAVIGSRNLVVDDMEFYLPEGVKEQNMLLITVKRKIKKSQYI